MKKILFLIIAFLLIVSVFEATSQNCGTVVTDKQIQLESTFVDSISKIIELDRVLYFSAHIVKEEGGGLGFNVDDLQTALFALNQFFETIGLRFEILKTDTIDNYNYNTVYYGDEEHLVDLKSVNNTINLYFVKNLYDGEGSPICAYTYMPGDNKDLMFFAKNCFSYTMLTEQVGHFLNLYHTHETAFGSELADQSNCSAAGDLCCDTYADPNLSGIVNDKCKYLGSTKDSQNTFYSPSTQNFMSFTHADCKCFFSEEQYIRMINAVLKLKKHLW